jgi:hypothetical protein
MHFLLHDTQVTDKALGPLVFIHWHCSKHNFKPGPLNEIVFAGVSCRNRCWRIEELSLLLSVLNITLSPIMDTTV